MDLIELPQVRGNRYCLTIIDRFSRWPVAIPLPNIEADTVATAFFNHWVCQFGTPLTITTDQGTQFESALFKAVAHLIGATHTHTTPYHPQSNGLIERWHRTLKTALMCHAPTPWPDILPIVLLGLRTSVKEDLGASPAELLLGSTLRLPGEFFVHSDPPADPQFFLEKFREYIRQLRPTPAAHHIHIKPFVYKDLYSCTHVFRRVDSVRRPLDPPYSGPHRVVKRVSDRVFVISIDGIDKTVSTETLKPAFVVNNEEDSDDAQPSTSFTPPVRTYQRKKKQVSFASPSGESTGGGVAVAPPLSPSAQAHVHTPALQLPRADRRKQKLLPRQVFVTSDYKT